VPIRDPFAIAERLTWLYDDEHRRLAMAQAARRKAADHGWARYQRRTVDLLRALAA
jgi:glycosyltransferase involved in cell wall biosynthesis